MLDRRGECTRKASSHLLLGLCLRLGLGFGLGIRLSGSLRLRLGLSLGLRLGLGLRLRLRLGLSRSLLKYVSVHGVCVCAFNNLSSGVRVCFAAIVCVCVIQ